MRHGTDTNMLLSIFVATMSMHRGLLDDVALHRAQRAEQFVFLTLRDLEFVECGDEITDQRIKRCC